MIEQDFSGLSEAELEAKITEASRELQARQDGKKKEVVAQIKTLAASVGVVVDIQDAPRKEAGIAPNRKGGTVAIKYRDPANPSNTWTGRGMKPKWLQSRLAEGHVLDEYLIQVLAQAA